jgi:Na+/H+ antiporter NhaD/arsenite permease-like protein
MQITALTIFAVTYLLISSRRLHWLGFDRPAGALLGAVACVIFGVLAPGEALAAVDTATILLLFGVMGMGAFLAVDGFFDDLEASLTALARTPARLLGLIVWAGGILSAFITNDAVCVLGAPLVVRLIQRHRLPPLPYLLALATAANTGSVATLVGNPQNMLCATIGGLEYRDHLLLLAPVALLGLAVNHALLRAIFRRDLRGATFAAGAPPTPPRLRGSSLLTLGVIAATAVAYTLGADLAWSATGGFVALMLLHRRDTHQLWSRIDWSLLLFFCGLFVVVEGLVRSGVPAAGFARYPLAATGDGLGGLLHLAGVFLVGSNVVSNVPFILVVRDQMASLPDPRLAWELLAMASTFAGNLTLLGSVANIIVAESARDIGGISFWAYLKVGLPLALVTTAMGTVWLWLVI